MGNRIKIKFLTVSIILIASTLTVSAHWATTSNNICNINTGNVGIGTIAPTVKLSIETQASENDETLLILGHRSNSGQMGTMLKIGTSGYNTEGTSRIVGYSNPHSVVYSRLALQTWNGSTWNNILMDGLGNLGIGTTTPAASLDVNGTTYSRKLFVGIPDVNTIKNMGSDNLLAVNGTAVFVKAKVALYDSCPDYVFTPTYKLPQLDSLQQFIKLNGHLPEMPNAKEVAKNGLDLGNNQALLPKKIEELTLIVIEQNKRIQKPEVENQMRSQEKK